MNMEEPQVAGATDLPENRLSPREDLEGEMRNLESQREQLRGHDGRSTDKIDAELEQLTKQWETADSSVALATPIEMQGQLENKLRKLELQRKQLRGHDGRSTDKIDAELEQLTQKLDRVRNAIAGEAPETKSMSKWGTKEAPSTSSMNIINEPTPDTAADDDVHGAVLAGYAVAGVKTTSEVKNKIIGVDTGVEHTVPEPPKDKIVGVDTRVEHTVPAPDDFQARYDREVLARKKEYQNLTLNEVAAQNQEITKRLEERITFFAARAQIRKEEFADQKPSEMNAKELRKFNDRMYQFERSFAQRNNNANTTISSEGQTTATPESNLTSNASTAENVATPENNSTNAEKVLPIVRKWWSSLSKAEKVLIPVVVAGLLGSSNYKYSSIDTGIVSENTPSAKVKKSSIDANATATQKLGKLGVVTAGPLGVDEELKKAQEVAKGIIASMRNSKSPITPITPITEGRVNSQGEQIAPQLQSEVSQDKFARATEIAQKMNIDPIDFKFHSKYTNIPIKINGQPVSPELYTDDERTALLGAGAKQAEAVDSELQSVKEVEKPEDKPEKPSVWKTWQTAEQQAQFRKENPKTTEQIVNEIAEKMNIPLVREYVTDEDGETIIEINGQPVPEKLRNNSDAKSTNQDSSDETVITPMEPSDVIIENSPQLQQEVVQPVGELMSMTDPKLNLSPEEFEAIEVAANNVGITPIEVKTFRFDPDKKAVVEVNGKKIG